MEVHVLTDTSGMTVNVRMGMQEMTVRQLSTASTSGHVTPPVELEEPGSWN